MKTSHSAHRVSLPRALSKLGLTSRSRALLDIADGKVAVNGKIEQNPHRWVNLKEDKILVSGKESKPRGKRYLVFHKPINVVTTTSDEKGKETIYDVLGSKGAGLIPVGRLDKNSSGLLLLTNDNQAADFLTNPEHEIHKTYDATIEKPVTPSDLQKLREGVEIILNGNVYRTKPAEVTMLSKTKIRIAIAEGKNRQVRKMLEELGFSVLHLVRISVGPFKLGTMKSGQVRELSADEVELLNEMMKRKRVTRGSRVQHISHV